MKESDALALFFLITTLIFAILFACARGGLDNKEQEITKLHADAITYGYAYWMTVNGDPKFAWRDPDAPKTMEEGR